MTPSPREKWFRIFNWTVLGLICYMAALPAIARVMRFFVPKLWICAYRARTGTSCPFCGTTTDLGRLWHGNFEFLNPMTPYLALVLVLELIWRIVLLVRRPLSRKQMIADFSFHLILLTGLFGAYLWLYCASLP